jgi:hypothetical protein
VELENLNDPLFVNSRIYGLKLRVHKALVDIRRGHPVDQQAEQFRAAVMTSRIHQPLAGVDLGKVEISDYFAFTNLERSVNDRSTNALCEWTACCAKA